YILVKKIGEWTPSQEHRAKLLFERYPLLERAYKHILHLRGIYKNTERIKAQQELNEWLEKTKELEIKEFNTVANTLKDRAETILNFFVNRNTNANAESFNAKIKLFRANLRGVTDTKFFLFRLEKLFS
ncbi:MAG TPA: transposase, partial [Edaphocola sp.]|nr:transposase [Edaphocola sp.]